MGAPAVFEVVGISDRLNYLVIRDVGMWDRQLTITNDAEGVVQRLDACGKLPTGRRLFYYDSDGDLDEIALTYEPTEGKGGTYYPAKFVGFRPCPVNHDCELPGYVG